jgi:hypothetical protein
VDTSALVELYRTASVAIDEYFCNGLAGRDKKDPVYQYVVEGRDVPATYTSYSSCADRAHAKLWRLGCRRRFVNREERSPLPHDWHIGQNISSLHDVSEGSPCLVNASGLACPPGRDWVPAAGAEMLIWNSGNDAHSLSVLSFDGRTARTANYGTMGMSAMSFPGCKEGSAPLVLVGNSWHYGSKVVQRVLTMEGIVASLTGDPDLTGIDGVLLEGMSEVLDAIAALRGAP